MSRLTPAIRANAWSLCLPILALRSFSRYQAYNTDCLGAID